MLVSSLLAKGASISDSRRFLITGATKLGGGVFRVSLKPDLNRSSEIDVTSHHLIVIQVPSSIDDEEIDELQFESHLRVSGEFEYPPGEISACWSSSLGCERKPAPGSIGDCHLRFGLVGLLQIYSSESFYTIWRFSEITHIYVFLHPLLFFRVSISSLPK